MERNQGRILTSIAVAKAKSKVEQEGKAPKREDQRQGKLIETPCLVLVPAAVAFFASLAFVIAFCIVVVNVLAFGS